MVIISKDLRRYDIVLSLARGKLKVLLQQPKKYGLYRDITGVRNPHVHIILERI